MVMHITYVQWAMAIYAKWTSITAVVLNNSFITLATRRTEKTTGASD